MKKTLFVSALILFCFLSRSQGYDIKINLKGAKDTVVYLWHYSFDKFTPVDTCRKVKNGVIAFKGKKTLDKGVYCLVSQEKAKYIDIFVNECSKMTISADMADVLSTLKCADCKENQEYFKYGYFFPKKNIEFETYRQQTKGKSKADSIKFMADKIKVLNDDLVKFEAEYMAAHKGTFIYDVLNMKGDKEAKEIPRMKNATDSSVFLYYYFKTHYWDGVDFNDDRILRAPYFGDKFKRYFEKVVMQVPDSVIKEIEMIMSRIKPGTDMNAFIMSKLTVDYENSKLMGFDKVFVHMGKYLREGRGKGVWDDDVVKKILDRMAILEPILLGKQSPDLLMIDSTNAKTVLRMGFDTAKTSEGLQKIYNANADKLLPLYNTLHSVKAKYTILVFWDVDCSHCQQEIPKLLETYHDLRKKYDVKVYSVYTVHDYQKYRKYIIDHKLDFINVWDPVHINNVKDKFDIYSTPVIYLLDQNKVIKAKRLSQEQIPEIIKNIEEMEKPKNK